jgi:hypothetical protein
MANEHAWDAEADGSDDALLEPPHSAIPASGVHTRWGELFALAEEVLPRALDGAPIKLSVSDREEVLSIAAGRASASVPVWESTQVSHALEVAALHAVRSTLSMWLTRDDASPLAEARRRAAQLKGLERQVFHAYAALDGVARAAEKKRLNPAIAIAFELRPNTVHQHLSRARQKLFARAPEWQDGWRFAVELPAEVARAARDYLDVVDAAPGCAERWSRAQAQHARRRHDLKVQSSGAARAWSSFVDALDASRVAPRDARAHLAANGDEIGLLDWIPESRGGHGAGRAELSWRRVLDDLPRPTGQRLAGWARLLAAQDFGVDATSAFKAFAAQSERAERARVELESAWRAWLGASSEMPSAFRETKATFQRRIEAW